MTDLFAGFLRKQFPVEAVRVTPVNIKEVAEACGGRIMHDGSKENELSRDYIKVRVLLPLNDEQTKARIGDWVVKQGRTFKVYKDRAFRKTFEKSEPEAPLAEQTFESKSEETVPEDRKAITLDELNKQN